MNKNINKDFYKTVENNKGLREGELYLLQRQNSIHVVKYVGFKRIQHWFNKYPKWYYTFQVIMPGECQRGQYQWNTNEIMEFDRKRVQKLNLTSYDIKI